MLVTISVAVRHCSIQPKIHENGCRQTDATANKHGKITDSSPLTSEQMGSECAVVTGVGVMVCHAAAKSEWGLRFKACQPY